MRMKMIDRVVFLLSIALVSCQYPQQRAPPLNYRPPSEAYEDYEEYGPPPRQQAPAQQAPRPSQRNSDILRPATVHYVNIGTELAGDYKFGYDTGKGNDGQSFREETRLPDGTVQGAYGYIDETGTQRIVKYTAGKDGFNIIKDGGSGSAPQSAPAQRAAPVPSAAPAPQQPYRPAQSSYRPAAPAQPAYRAPPAAQPVYRAPPASQPAYREQATPAYRPQPDYRETPSGEPVYGAQPAQPVARHNPQPRPRPQPSRPRYSPPPKETYEEAPDYDYPNNDISERRLVPVDTSLFNYNIGTSQNRS